MIIPVAFLGGSFRRGGAERDLLEVLARIDRRRFDPHMFYLERVGDLLPEYEKTGVPMRALGFVSLKSLAVPAGVSAARALLEDRGVRVFHAFGIYAALYAAVIARTLPRVSLVSYEFTSTRPRSLRERIFQPWYYRRSRAIVCNSDAVMAMVRGRWGVSEDRLVKIYNGVDVARFDPERARDTLAIDGVPPGAPVVGCVARLHPIKGHRHLIEAWPRIAAASPEARLVLVGGGDARQRGEMERLARATGLGNRIHFLGARPDVAALLARMDVVVVPSLAEGFCNAVLEAGAAGRPIVATRVGGNPEAIADEDTGLLVPPADPGAIATAVCRVLSDRDLAARIGQAARRRVSSLFTVERMVQEYEGLYARLAGDGEAKR